MKLVEDVVFGGPIQFNNNTYVSSINLKEYISLE